MSLDTILDLLMTLTVVFVLQEATVEATTSCFPGQPMDSRETTTSSLRAVSTTSEQCWSLVKVTVSQPRHSVAMLYWRIMKSVIWTHAVIMPIAHFCLDFNAARNSHAVTVHVSSSQPMMCVEEALSVQRNLGATL
jgi:hypothetical protein